MAPEIFTTGKQGVPIAYRTLEGEPDEAVRAAVRNKTVNASVRIFLCEPEIAREYLGDLGMGEENASAIVNAALEDVSEVGVRFETIFLEEGRIGGLRRYQNFQFFNNSEEDET